MPKDFQKVTSLILFAGAISISGADESSLRGRVILDGEAPPEIDFKLSEEAARRGAPTKTQKFLIGDGNGLANVVVKVKGPGLGLSSWSAQKDQLVVTANKYRFEPLVSAIQIGQKVSLRNLDAIGHDFHVIPRVGSGGNWTIDSAQPPKTIEFPGTTNYVALRCPEHPWMTATVYIFEDPFFAVTDKNGRFEIKGLPKGKYSIEADHANSEKTAVDFEIDSASEEIVIRIQPKQQRTALQYPLRK